MARLGCINCPRFFLFHLYSPLHYSQYSRYGVLRSAGPVPAGLVLTMSFPAFLCCLRTLAISGADGKVFPRAAIVGFNPL